MSEAHNVGIKDSWSLRKFRSQVKEFKLAKLANKETGEEFTCIMAGVPGDYTQIRFSSNLGALTASQISSMADQLQVCLLESGNYSLCKQGENSWEDIVF